MTQGQPRILRARVVLPVSQPPIDNGAVLVSGGRVEWIGSWSDVPGPAADSVLDLGDSVLLPGLVNAHCHLDYTEMAGQIPATKYFTDWIKSITTLKAGWSYTEFANSWVNGAQMLLRSGTTTVADIEAAPELLPEVWYSTPLRVFSFLEMTGVRSRRDPQAILADAVQTIESLPAGRCKVGLSPHAPYSTPPALQRLSADYCRQRSWRMTTHVAESMEEFEMFCGARGSMHDWLARNERDMSDCGHGSPVAHLHRLGALGKHTLAVHVNCLAEGDIELLASTQTSVVHCPQSHRFFNHPPFPFDALHNAGINICLGTDSLASSFRKPGTVPSLDMFAEMRLFHSHHPQISPDQVLEFATLRGALALGLECEIGQIAPGTSADLIVVPYQGAIENAAEATVHHKGLVKASMIDGVWAIPPEQFSS